MITRKANRTRAEFDAYLAEHHIRGQWRLNEGPAGPTEHPAPQGVPYLWKWATVRELLAEATEVLAEALQQRRSLLFANPGLESGGTTHTFGVGIQLVIPGELAWAHRHTMAAIRFGIEGDERLVTVVDGRSVPMEPNDLVLTPSLTWHDHCNGSEREGMWLDAIDSPLMRSLGQRVNQPYGQQRQPLEPRAPEEAYRFRWAQTRAQLADAPESPYDGRILKFHAPQGPDSTLPTLGCSMTALRPGFESREHRHASSAVYFVVQGQGVTYAADQVLRWSERDTFVIPSWTNHRHVNDSPGEAILFSVTDEPLLRAIGLYREDSLG